MAQLANLLRYFGLRHLRRHLGRTLLGFTAIALGVALFVSADVANTSVVAALEQSSVERAGRAEWRVMRARSIGVEIGLLQTIRALPGAIAAPVIETSGNMVEPVTAPLLLIGVDFASDAMLRLYQASDGQRTIDPAAALATMLAQNPILLARKLAERNGLRPGATVTIDTRAGRQQFTVTGLIDAPQAASVANDGLALIGIEPAQRLFRRPGWVDRIDVGGTSLDALRAACPGCEILSAHEPDPLVVDAMAQLRSLVVISLIAVLVGIFIVYNTVTVAVVERLKEIGTLRAIGARRGEILRALLAEWAVVGALGSLAGIAGGWALAKVMLAFAAGMLNALTRTVEVRQIVLAPSTAALAFGLGTAATLAAAWLPVARAMQHPPVAILRAHSLRKSHSFLPAFWCGLLSLTLAILLIWVLRRWLTIALAATALFFLGLALLLPQLTIWVARWLRPGLARLCRVEGFLAADNTTKFPQRTALTVTALGGSLAMLVASATLIEAFRTQSQRWLDYTLPFDVAVTATNFKQALYGGTVFPEEIQDEVRAQPCVGDCYGVRAAFCDVDQRNVMCVAVEMAGFARAQARRPPATGRERFEDPVILQRLIQGEGLCISDNFAQHYGTGVGDHVTLATRDGPRRLPVLAIIEDYSWPRGVVFLDLAHYRRLLGDTTLNYVDVVLAPGWDVERARAQLVAALSGARSAYVFAKQDILEVAEAKLDEMMMLANVQVLLALVIGFLGIVNTLLISVLQRTREVGLLRAIGMTRSQVGRTVVLESLLMAAVGGGLGIAIGLLGGWYPLRLFTLQMTGYWTPAVVPWLHVGLAAFLALCIGAAAAWVPARAAARLDVLGAIGYE